MDVPLIFLSLMTKVLFSGLKMMIRDGWSLANAEKYLALSGVVGGTCFQTGPTSKSAANSGMFKRLKRFTTRAVLTVCGGICNNYRRINIFTDHLDKIKYFM